MKKNVETANSVRKKISTGQCGDQDIMVSSTTPKNRKVNSQDQ